MTEMNPNKQLQQVRIGVQVVDYTGNRLGQVELVQLPSADAAAVDANQQTTTGLGGALKETALEPDVPEPRRSELIRYGFIKLDNPDLGDINRYVRSDQIREVSGDTVKLSVMQEQTSVAGMDT
ncbi:MAG: hypothetical protein ACLFVO_21120 [Chloroflexaceae bacterium]